jgi:hypothetical protein
MNKHATEINKKTNIFTVLTVSAVKVQKFLILSHDQSMSH